MAKQSTIQKFQTVLQGIAANPQGAAIVLPFDPREVWGKARVPVKVTVNRFEFRSTIACMGGCDWVGLNAKVREGAGVKQGDKVSVTIEPDTEPRVIEVPAEMKKALGAKLTTKLEALAYTHKKEFVQWFTEAKKEETRQRRVEKMKEMLAAGKTIS